MDLVCTLIFSNGAMREQGGENSLRKFAKSLVKISTAIFQFMVRIITSVLPVFTKLSPLINSVTEFLTVVLPSVFLLELSRTDGKVASKIADQPLMVILTELQLQSLRLPKKLYLINIQRVYFLKAMEQSIAFFYFFFWSTTANWSPSFLKNRRTKIFRFACEYSFVFLTPFTTQDASTAFA